MSLFEITDIAGLSKPLCRVIDCLEKGISSVVSPFVYKRMERAKMLIEQERSNQNSVITLKEAMTEDFVAAARTTRERQEIANISSIYSNALQELESIEDLKLPDEQVSTEWASLFYDNAKYCSDEEVQLLWSKILAGEIQEPGKYYKRTLVNLKQMERHEAEWFCNACKYTLDGICVPVFAIEDDFLPYNQYQSLADCGFMNADQGRMEIPKDCIIQLKSRKVNIKRTGIPFQMDIITLTDTGMQICELVQTETDEKFLNKLLCVFNDSKLIEAHLL